MIYGHRVGILFLLYIVILVNGDGNPQKNADASKNSYWSMGSQALNYATMLAPPQAKMAIGTGKA